MTARKPAAVRAAETLTLNEKINLIKSLIVDRDEQEQIGMRLLKELTFIVDVDKDDNYCIECKKVCCFSCKDSACAGLEVLVCSTCYRLGGRKLLMQVGSICKGCK